MPLPQPTTERVRRLGADISLTLTPDEIDRIVDELDGGRDGYEKFLEAVERPTTSRSDRHLSGLAIDPPTTDDPFNAYLSTFELQVDHPRRDTLAGLDVVLKDNIAVAGVPMTCGSTVFETCVPDRDATVTERLLDTGARIAGKTNMDELAYGPTSETSQFGSVENPHNSNHVAGGSSSGSAAAVAAGEADAALGSDTGGSVRIPASFCGLVGFKPTWGAVSRAGFVELAHSLDHIGVISTDVRTVATVFASIVGHDPRDATAAHASLVPVDQVEERLSDAEPLSGRSFGVPDALFGDHVSEPVRTTVRGSIDSVAAAGATVEPVSIPSLSETVSAWNAIANAEFAAYLDYFGTPVPRRATLDAGWRGAAATAIQSRADEFGPVIKRKAVEGRYLLKCAKGRPYVRARAYAERFRAAFESALDGHDALVAPTMPVVAPEMGSRAPHTYSSTSGEAGPPLAANTRQANLAGLPAVTVPCGMVDGLPVGIQFVGSSYQDVQVLEVAHKFEQSHRNESEPQ